MVSSPRGRHGPTLAEGLVVLAFLAVPLAATPRFLDQFTSVKWYVLGAVAAAWLLVERFLCGSRGLPGFVVRTWPGWVALGSLVVAGSLRKGPGWAMEPLVARGTFVAIALAAFWYFRRTRLRLAPVRAATLVALAIVVVLGLVQLVGFEPLPWLTAGDHRSATFGNVNMTAQFVGLALVVLLSERGGSRSVPLAVGLALLVGGGLAYVCLAGTRSVALALAAAAVVLLRADGLAIGPAVRAAALAFPLLWVVLRAGTPGSGLLSPEARDTKALSAGLRLSVWSDTLDLVREHPLGVGAGNFEHAFIPYALAGRSRPRETLVFRSPHNEYLRVVAEEGLGGAILLLGLVALLVRGLHRSAVLSGWRSDPGVLLTGGAVFLGVEAFFQFPFEVAFPSLLAAALLGLALACLDGSPASPGAGSEAGNRSLSRAGDVACLAVALAIAAGVTRVAVAESLPVSHRDDVAALEHACALDPRRMEACVEAAWLRSRKGEHATARRDLTRVLERSPSYFPAIKLLGEVALADGDREAGCRALAAYDSMFGGRSSASGLRQSECGR
jgi:O-antigen ligase